MNPPLTTSGNAFLGGRLSILWTAMPFALILAFIYASGYIVVATYMNKFNLPMSLHDFWKAKYLHIGVLASALPLLASSISYGLCTVYMNHKHPKPLSTLLLLDDAIDTAATKESERPDRFILYLISLLNIICAVLSLAMFIRSNEPERNIESVRPFLFLTLYSTISIWLIQKAHQRNLTRSHNSYLRGFGYLLCFKWKPSQSKFHNVVKNNWHWLCSIPAIFLTIWFLSHQCSS